MNTRSISWGLRRKADNLPPSCAVVTKSGNLSFLEPSGPLRACNGTALPLLLSLWLSASLVPLYGFLWNFMLEVGTKICRTHLSLFNVWQNPEDLLTFTRSFQEMIWQPKYYMAPYLCDLHVGWFFQRYKEFPQYEVIMLLRNFDVWVANHWKSHSHNQKNFRTHNLAVLHNMLQGEKFGPQRPREGAAGRWTLFHNDDLHNFVLPQTAIIIIIIIIIISFMQGIYTYIPETNYVPREYSVPSILLLLFMVLISLVSVLNILYYYHYHHHHHHHHHLLYAGYLYSYSWDKLCP